MPIPLNAYEDLARQMMDIYGEAELIMLQRVAKRLAKGVASPGWTERKYAEMSQVRKQLSELLNELSGKRGRLASSAIETAYSGGADWFFADAKQAALALGIGHISPRSARVAAILGDLNHTLSAADRAILRRANDAYADVIGRVAALTATGSITTRDAVRRAVSDLADRGILSFTDSAGRSWQMDTYAEMAMLTAIQRAALLGYTDTMAAYGYDLAILSSHEGACPICAAWQGVVLSVSGEDRHHPSLEDARGAGVFHPRCLHHISIYHPGITHGEARSSPRKVQPASSAYTARSRQRYCERQIRRYKRRQAAATMPEDERAARNFVTKWQRLARENIAAADGAVLRDYSREGGRVKLSEAARKLRAKAQKVLKNAAGKVIIPVKKTGKKGPPDSITQVVNKKGGIDRNYYDEKGLLFKQISNYNHGNAKQHPFGRNGEHAHDIIWTDDHHADRPVRELTDDEREENADIL